MNTGAMAAAVLVVVCGCGGESATTEAAADASAAGGSPGIGGAGASGGGAAVGGGGVRADASTDGGAGRVVETGPAGDGSVRATTEGGGALCPSLGWCEIVGTQLHDVCPDETRYASIQANEGCSAVINDWSGGAQDESRNRLIVWGGGHGGYFGNELYALDLNALTMVRLNDPSDITGYDMKDCYAPDMYPDGRPASRHTYDGLAYVAPADRMYAFSGAKAPCGYQGSDTWLLDLGAITTAPSGQAAPWTLVTPSASGGKPGGGVGVIADYDPVSKRVIMSELASVWAFDVGTGTYSLLNNQNAGLDYHMTGRVNPKRSLFVAVGASGSQGGGVIVFDIAAGASHARQDWTSQMTGCGGLASEIYPGLAYDPVQDKMVGWPGGDSVYVVDLDAKSCTEVAYPNGPGPQNGNGTNGRFRYFPSLKVFALVNDWQQNAFALRLTQ